MTPRLLEKDSFLLGTFTSNCSSGMTITKAPGRWDASWEKNLKLGKMLDEAGIDFMLPVARWVGNGGETNFHGSVLETITWATGLLAQTENLTVFSTIHTKMNHPIVVAKQLATMDHISDSRVGLNIVAGWNQPEYEAFGLDLPPDHETRYGYAQEWFDVIKKLWANDERFDHLGDYFNLKNVHSDPKPQRRMPILNAAGSQVGREFAVRNADFLFTSALDLSRSKDENDALKEQAQEVGRNVGVLTFSHVICRPTEKEAKDFLQYYARDNVDQVARDRTVDLNIAHSQSFPHDLLEQIRESFAVGHGGYQLVGTPEQVADGITNLYEAGFGGTTLSFFDYVEEFPYFRDNVLPILEDRGIRPVAA